MEISNTLHSFLFTQNQLSIDLILIPFFFIENVLRLLLFHIIFNIKSPAKYKFTYLFLSSLFSIITILFFPKYFNVIFSFIYHIFFIYFIFKVTFIKSCIFMMVTSIVFHLTSIFLTAPFLSLYNITSSDLYTIPYYRLIYLTKFYSLVTIFTIFSNFFKLRVKLLDDLDRKNKLLLFSFFIISGSLLLVQINLLFRYIDILSPILIFVDFLSLCSHFIMGIFCLNKIFNFKQTSDKLNNVELHNKTLSSLHDEIRCFKHDFDNILTTLGGYILTEDFNGLTLYYNDLVKDSQRVNNLYVLNPVTINNSGLFYLLNTKYTIAESYNIRITITFLLDLTQLQMKIYEFTKIIGILLDNAIEASVESDTKIINLVFRNDFKSNCQIITIENTYEQKDIVINDIFKKGFSSKKDHTGIGLWEVNKIISRYDNIHLNTYKNDTIFTQELKLYHQVSLV